MPAQAEKGRLVIVSNRLPVSVKNMGEGRYETKPSSGGLVTGIRGLVNSGVEFIWFGWPGEEIAKDSISGLKGSLLKDHNAVPVLLDKRVSDLHYNGFSNSTIWPLFHYQLDKVCFDERYMNGYREANEAFADTMMLHLKDGDQIWVHDYHLMLLPSMLRQRAEMMNININIGWFLHTPFPDCGFLDVLPSRAEILDGILGADVVGFQTDQARHNFLDTCSQTLKWWTTDTGVLCDDREVSAQTFPIGIEPSEYYSRLRKDCVQMTLRKMKKDFYGTKLILGVDRLDCIKGLPQKLHAFDRLLEKYPELIGHVSLLQLVIPSRDDLKAHQDLKDEIHQLVGRINGRHGKVSYVPVQFLYTSIDPDELTALDAAADVCFISSTRDGMNLVCYEYVACHSQKAVQSSNQYIVPGSLVLSKFAGAANMMDGALIVNPWDRDVCADALLHALSMDAIESSAKMRKLGALVERQTSSRWGFSFVQALDQVCQSRVAKEKRRCDSAIDFADLEVSPKCSSV